MATVRTVEELTALYDEPVASSLVKEIDHITALHRAYIEASPFVIVASSGPGGLDCSPRGDPAGFVQVIDERTLHLPDRRGNNRLDTLRNVVADPRVALLFLVPGIGVTLRVNGTAEISTDGELLEQHTLLDKRPTCVVVVTATAVYTQCPKALIRSNLWDPAGYRRADELPSVGQINELITAGAFDGAAFDAAYPQRVRDTIY
jgi:PPOX class probable FMN-dependent enzyme